MESTARQRLATQLSNDGTDFTNDKTPSGLEGGILTNDSRNNGATAGTGDMADPPLTKGKRFKEFKRRLRGKHVEHVPTLRESLTATTKIFRTYFIIIIFFLLFPATSMALISWRPSGLCAPVIPVN
jgi:hypothetical protein